MDRSFEVSGTPSFVLPLAVLGLGVVILVFAASKPRGVRRGAFYGRVSRFRESHLGRA